MGVQGAPCRGFGGVPHSHTLRGAPSNGGIEPLQRKMTRRSFLKAATRCALSAGMASLGGYEYVKKVEPGWLDVTNVGLILPRLPPGFDGYRLAQVSDIHLGGWMDRARLAEV